MEKLNLGCGTRILKGYVNLDAAKLKGVNVVHNINKRPFPFSDNHFDEIVARNILEHTENMIATMKEIHRILKPGGKLIFRVPLGFTYNSANVDHRWHLYPHNFFYFTKKRGWFSRLFKIANQDNLCDFEFEMKKMYVTTPIIHLKFPYQLCFLNAFINFIFSGIEGVMIKK